MARNVVAVVSAIFHVHSDYFHFVVSALIFRLSSFRILIGIITGLDMKRSPSECGKIGTVYRLTDEISSVWCRDPTCERISTLIESHRINNRSKNKWKSDEANETFANLLDHGLDEQRLAWQWIIFSLKPWNIANWDGNEWHLYFHFSIEMWRVFHCLCIIHDFWSLQRGTMAAELERYVQHISKCLALHWIVNQPRLRRRRERRRMRFSKCIVSGCIVLCTAWSQRSIIFFSFSPLMSLDLCTFCVSSFPNTYRLVSRTSGII